MRTILRRDIKENATLYERLDIDSENARIQLKPTNAFDDKKRVRIQRSNTDC